MVKDKSSPESANLTKSLLDITVESWRFGKLFVRLLSKLDAGEQVRFQGQYRWFQRKLEESLSTAGLKLVNIEGQAFDPGVAATPLNIDEFEAHDSLVVDQMLEPIIMGPEGLVKNGTVMLRKVAS